MTSHHPVVRAVIGLIALAVPAISFTYTLNDSFPNKGRFAYSEGWMYGTNDGPPLASQGLSYVHVDLEVSAM